jgi:hypothetical protein
MRTSKDESRRKELEAVGESGPMLDGRVARGMVGSFVPVVGRCACFGLPNTANFLNLVLTAIREDQWRMVEEQSARWKEELEEAMSEETDRRKRLKEKKNSEMRAELVRNAEEYRKRLNDTMTLQNPNTFPQS